MILSLIIDSPTFGPQTPPSLRLPVTFSQKLQRFPSDQWIRFPNAQLSAKWLRWHSKPGATGPSFTLPRRQAAAVNKTEISKLADFVAATMRRGQGRSSFSFRHFGRRCFRCFELSIDQEMARSGRLWPVFRHSERHKIVYMCNMHFSIWQIKIISV